MSGWRRLWVVASILLGAPTLLIAMSVKDFQESMRNEKDVSVATRWVNDTTLEMRSRCNPKEVAKAEWDSYGGGYTGYAYCTTKQQIALSFLFALLPGALLAALGLTIRWIYRGFRTPRE